MGTRTATTVWKLSPELISPRRRLGLPVDSYVNGSQTWLTEVADDHHPRMAAPPVGGYRTPKPLSHYDVWEAVTDGLRAGTDPHALRLGDETRPITSLWDGLECFAAYGDDVEPQRLAALATGLLAIPPDGIGLVDHESIGDAWEAQHGNVSIVALLLEQLTN
jgi:hypothetical protein